MVGGISGEAGKSLQITVSGSAAGRFLDFANDKVKGATPLWLWSQVKGITFPEAVKQAKDWLGVRDDDYGVHRHKSKTYLKPDKGGVRLAEPNTAVMDYLILERKLDPIVVSNAKVCETDDGLAMVFPFIEHDAESGKDIAVHRKYLKLERVDGKKQSWATKGTKRCLYGKNLIGENVSEIVVCEGEIDSLSWQSWKIPAVSIPNGVSDFEWMDADWEWLARFEKIYVSCDMDEPGRLCSIEICKRLGLHRCYVVELPLKDANECLVGDLTRETMLACLSNAKAIELDEIKRPKDFRDEVMDYYHCDPKERGVETPWTPDLPWRIRKSEFTILSGYSGHGKTMAINQILLHCISKGMKVMDASLEVKPGMTLYSMTRCALARKFSDATSVEACIDWLNDSVFFLDCIGVVSVARIMHAMEYARKRHGIDVFVIDSLFKCGLASEDYSGARDFADKLTTFCNNTGAHVILVAHSRKTQNGNELTPPSKSDVAGSSDLTNAAFNVIILFRNKMKKRKMDEARQANDFEELAKWTDQPDGRIILDKQRFGEGEECEIFVYFEKESGQYHVKPNLKIPYFVMETEKKV